MVAEMNQLEATICRGACESWDAHCKTHKRRHATNRERSAVQRATPLVVKWAQSQATNYAAARDKADVFAEAKRELVEHIRLEQYSGFGSVWWIILSAVISFFVEWFLRWLFWSTENYAAVMGK